MSLTAKQFAESLMGYFAPSPPTDAQYDALEAEIAERDHRMRVEGAVAALVDQGPKRTMDRHEAEAERIVREMKEAKR